jgi:hypothetical protein
VQKKFRTTRLKKVVAFVLHGIGLYGYWESQIGTVAKCAILPLFKYIHNIAHIKMGIAANWTGLAANCLELPFRGFQNVGAPRNDKKKGPFARAPF